MVKLVKGDVVVIPFPFTDLSNSKKRPAVVLTDLIGDDCLLIQITSKTIKDNYALPITDNDFESGTLNQDSNIRPNKIFTLDKNLISYKIGKLSDEMTQRVVSSVIDIIKS